MSSLPMAVPAGGDAPARAELIVTLLADWQIDLESLKDERWHWPVGLIKYLARFPHKHQTWLGFGHTVPHGDPATPYAENTGLCGVMLLAAVSAPAGFSLLQIDEATAIAFYALVPLRAGEMDYKLRVGMDKLLDRLDRKKRDDVVDIGRKDVTVKWLGLW